MSTTSRGLGHAWQQLCEEAKRVYPPVCWRCHVRIDMTLPKTNRWSWTLDHLDARATHGTAVPTIDRVRPAHRRCNSQRGKRNLEPSPRSRTW